MVEFFPFILSALDLVSRVGIGKLSGLGLEIRARSGRRVSNG